MRHSASIYRLRIGGGYPSNDLATWALAVVLWQWALALCVAIGGVVALFSVHAAIVFAVIAGVFLALVGAVLRKARDIL